MCDHIRQEYDSSPCDGCAREEKLAAELARVTKERDRAIEHATDEEAQKWSAIQERDEARAEIERLHEVASKTLQRQGEATERWANAADKECQRADKAEATIEKQAATIARLRKALEDLLPWVAAPPSDAARGWEQARAALREEP